MDFYNKIYYDVIYSNILFQESQSCEEGFSVE